MRPSSYLALVLLALAAAPLAAQSLPRLHTKATRNAASALSDLNGQIATGKEALIAGQRCRDGLAEFRQQLNVDDSSDLDLLRGLDEQMADVDEWIAETAQSLRTAIRRRDAILDRKPTQP